MKTLFNAISTFYLFFALIQIINAGDYLSIDQSLVAACYFMLCAILAAIEEGQDHDPS